jgi:hypothetical protein
MTIHQLRELRERIHNGNDWGGYMRNNTKIQR